MNDYNCEQYEAVELVRGHLEKMTVAEKAGMVSAFEDYLHFRRSVDRFLEDHFSSVCNRACYQNRRSACCSREGIITFFADVVVNLSVSTVQETSRLLDVLKKPNSGSFKCVYLNRSGCLWRIKPIVCALFLCDRAQQAVFESRPDLKSRWTAYKEEGKRFTWPDRPVLFDAIESLFRDAGHESTLMYLHNSPGLLRVKRLSGLMNADE